MNKSKLIFITIFISIVTFINTSAQNKIKVACVGNSITYGSCIEDREKNCYPTILNSLLGSNFEVRNFGISARTLLKKGDMPYLKEPAMDHIKQFNPDIIVIKLGTNDSKAHNWKYKKDFIPDLKEMVKIFQKCESSPKIFLCLPVPAFKGNKTEYINDSIIYNGIIPKIKFVAEKKKLKVIDLYTPFVGQEYLFADGVHPNNIGARRIANILYTEIINIE